jgi:uncharacterized protein
VIVVAGGQAARSEVPNQTTPVDKVRALGTAAPPQCSVRPTTSTPRDRRSGLRPLPRHCFPISVARAPAAAICPPVESVGTNSLLPPLPNPTGESIALRTKWSMTTGKGERWMDTDDVESGRGRFRILALDGGGIRGAFTASVLAELEKQTGTRCGERFDLITGTSTGGLLAIALALGHPAERLCQLYRENGRTIFPLVGRVKRFGGLLRQLRKNKYDQTALRAVLTSVLGEARLGDARTRLVIPAYDLTNGRVFVFKTRHIDRFRYDVNVPAVEIAMCTSAAPTYFPANLLPEHARTAYVDGGVWANTPVMVGITEAVGFLGKSLDALDVLSVGTTSPVPDFSDEIRSGLVGWGPRLSSLFMTAQAQGTVAMAEVLCGKSFHRINAVVPNDWMAMDSIESVEKLIGAGLAEAHKNANYRVVSSRFLNDDPAEPFRDAGTGT